MDAQSLIACWELARRRHPLDRALLLYAAAAPEEDPDSTRGSAAGQAQCRFAAPASLIVWRCAEVLCRLSRLRRAAGVRPVRRCLAERAAGHALTHAQLGALCLRLPTTRDLASVAAERDETRAARKLLERLVDTPPGELGFSDETRHARSTPRTRAWISRSICPARRVTTRGARCSMCPLISGKRSTYTRADCSTEVHALARTYGWSEEQILALSETRRRAYLERVLG